MTLRHFTTDSSPADQAKMKSAGSLGAINWAKFIAFTCTVCFHRNRKSFAKQSYERGVVIIRCGGCRMCILIADNLGWFDGAKNVEEELTRGVRNCSAAVC